MFYCKGLAYLHLFLKNCQKVCQARSQMLSPRKFPELAGGMASFPRRQAWHGPVRTPRPPLGGPGVCVACPN